MRITVMVPAERIPFLKALTLEWRREAKILLEQDMPTADQILQIHAVCRTLDIPLPVLNEKEMPVIVALPMLVSLLVCALLLVVMG